MKELKKEVADYLTNKTEALRAIIRMSQQGHAGIARDGSIVDIREYPESVRIKQSESLIK